MTELFIEGTSVELSEDIAMGITYAISDIKDPFSRSGSYSKTVKIPSTPTVDQLFDHVFEINRQTQNTSDTNFNPDFNPNLKASIIVCVHSIEQFRGYMRLRSISRDKNGLDNFYYNVELFGELGSIIIKMGDAKLSDLDFSEFNHTYNRTNQKASWSANYTHGYFYPMIDCGLNDNVNWRVEHFFPAIYERQYWDKMFNYIGCNYSGTFPTSAPFTKFCIPFTGDSFKLTEDQALDRLFSANISAPYTALDNSTWSAIPEPFVFDNEVSDPDAQYSPVTGKFSCASQGYYEFVFSGSYFWSAVGGSWSGASANTMNVLFYHKRGATITMLAGYSVANNQASLSAGNSSATVNFTITSPTQLCYAGDEVWVKVAPVFVGTITGGQFAQFNLNAGASFSNTVQNASVVEGGLIDMNAAVPEDIRLADYFLAVVKEFNLMVEPDRTVPEKYIIDVANDFYSTGNSIDWSEKHDVSKPWEQQPMGALDFRRLILTRQESDDRYNKNYRELYGENYGTKKHDVNNDFLQNEEVYESIFTDTPLVGRASDDRVYPAIYTLDTNNQPKPTAAGVRRLYVGGAISTNVPWNYVTVSGQFVENTYPYAGHLDSVSAPTFDLCFDKPKMVFYNAITYTDGNLYNRYHKKYVEEITDKDSKLITAYFYLKPKDILQLSFRDIIYVHDAYYRLQKVFDYNPTKEQSTKCELLKIIEATPFNTTTYPVYNFLDSNTGVTINFQGGTPGTTYHDGVVIGNGNSTQRSMGSLIGGYQNRVGDNTTGITVVGSSGVTVYPSLTNVTVINTNDVTITESNVVYLNGRKIWGGATTHITTNTTVTAPGSYTTASSPTITLSPSDSNDTEQWTFTQTDAGTTVIGGGGVNINGSATYSLTVQYQSVTIMFNGSQYYIV
jgi:hypothetical protein